MPPASKSGHLQLGSQPWYRAEPEGQKGAQRFLCIFGGVADPDQVRVPTAQGKQGKWTKKIPVRENTGNLEMLSKHRENKGNFVRDWSLIMGRGGLQNGKIAGLKLFAPPPQDRVKLFAPPLLKSRNFSRPPYNMT